MYGQCGGVMATVPVQLQVMRKLEWAERDELD